MFGIQPEYNHFVVEKWIPEPKGRLLRLLKYTRGEAHTKHEERFLLMLLNALANIMLSCHFNSGLGFYF